MARARGLNEENSSRIYRQHCAQDEGSNWGDLPDGPVVKIVLPRQGPQVQFLVGEIRSRMPHGQQKRGEEEQLGMVRQPGTSRTGKLQPPLGLKGQARAW